MMEQAPHGVDSAIPNIARIYDYLLGGKDNFAADRAAAERFLEVVPDIAAIAADNRAFLGRAVRYLAREAGIRQFLDLGGGLPTRSNVHEIAQQAAPDARVAYIDYDPVVVRHGEALLANGSNVAMAHADLTRPDTVLNQPEVRRVLDLSQPLALICTATLHFVPDEAHPHAVIAEYRDRVAAGSYLVISHAATHIPGRTPADAEAGADAAAGIYRQASAQLHLRTPADIRRFFDGFDLVEPGVVWMSEWRPLPGTRPAGRMQSLYAAVGCKP
ncbi:MAG TPA: SAM-dependent methyltransferase [Trebonia sp.]|nr:SAM-dependent methyltransferase [Trebonia sp.]